MESPQHVGDTTTSSIAHQLYGTHIHKTPLSGGLFQPPKLQPSVTLAVFSGQKFIQLSLELAAAKGGALRVLRRVQDSYVNVSQMLEPLVVLKHYSSEQVASFCSNEIITNTQYLPESKTGLLPLFNDFSDHEVPQIRGLWIPFDKAIAISVKFDIYKLVKPLFLVDVHDFDKLPVLGEDVSASPNASPGKRTHLGAGPDSYPESPSKKRKTAGSSLSGELGRAELEASLKKAVAGNSNYPYTLPPATIDDTQRDLVAEAKLLFHEIFKSEDVGLLSKQAVETRLAPIFEKCHAQGLAPASVLDVALDLKGKTALHYAATLACETLAQSLLELRACSPIRGDNKGESPLAATVQVTNAMMKGNFADMLETWLWPGLWLFDNNNQSVFHYLILLAAKNPKSSRFYLGKILEWVIASPEKKQHLETLCGKIVHAQETKSGNTALHLAGENGLKWYVFLLLELNADLDVTNGMGVKPTSFDCVNQVVEARKTFKNNPVLPATTTALLEALESDEENDEYLILLVHTGVEFWTKLLPFSGIGEPEEEKPASPSSKELTPTSEVLSSSILSNKIFRSIQDLLSNTNEEYEKVIHAKKAEINNLNKELRDATIVTANNRLIAKSIASKMSQVDAMKLQMMNINDKVQLLKKDLGSLGDEDVFNPEWDVDPSALEKYDADEPFIIREIYDKIASGEEIEPTQELIDSLPPTEILKARLKAYEEVNKNLEEELAHLVNYGDLTAQFKKVVSSCTGVDINEVDELLDGLLEAVEGQQ